MQKLKCVWNKQTLTKLLQNFKKWLQQSSVIKSNFKPYWILANIFDMPTNRPKFAIVVQQYFLLQRINNDGSLFYVQSTHWVVAISCALLIILQEILKSIFLRFKLQTCFEWSTSFSYIPYLKDLLWLAYLNLNWVEHKPI